MSNNHNAQHLSLSDNYGINLGYQLETIIEISARIEQMTADPVQKRMAGEINARAWAAIYLDSAQHGTARKDHNEVMQYAAKFDPTPEELEDV